MVMHARKTQRMSDGYFEKHQTHPYQNSKYSSSKSYGSGGERYERIRDSPNGNYRSDSPDSQSPRDRDRSYQSKSYLQKIREKERENRDYKMSRDKYPDCARSPKDKRSRDSEHRTNHDRGDDKNVLHPIKSSSNLSSRDRKPVHNNCIDKRDDRDRVTRIGDWSEHISSSGKKYYYNCKTEVSQWEKPREWIERERDRFRARDRDRDSDRYSSSSRSGKGHDKHSNTRGSNSSSSKETSSRDGATGSRHWSGGRGDDGGGGGGDPPPKESSSSSRSSSRKHSDDAVQTTQDMDISPGDSTPTSELSYCQGGGGAVVDQNSHGGGGGPVLLANALPRLVSHPTMHVPSTPTSARPESSPLQSAPASLAAAQSAGPAGATAANAPGPPAGDRGETADVKLQTMHGGVIMNRQVVVAGDNSVHTQLLAVDTNHSGPVVEGPPTPTHSETSDCTKVTLPAASPPGNSLPTIPAVQSSLHALRPQGPTITPSLANHYRDDLTCHVKGWPADILEKQAQKLSEEAHIMGSIQCSKVSAELKPARSLVRLTEIQATLQEQRILFLRQQIKTLEELKSQNSFMSDDS